MLLLGGTGAGKSTTIHFLAGSKMEKVFVNGRLHIQPSEIKNKQAEAVETSASCQSCTRYIIPVPITYGVGNNKSIMLCDTPGFEDTAGPEVDIANGIGVIQAIKGCKSVIPAILMSSLSIGDRYQLLKPLIYLLAGMLANYTDALETFQYIFTKFQPEEQSGIKSRIEEIYSNLTEEEQEDEAFKAFFENLCEKTLDDEHIFLNPIEDDSKSIIRKLTKIKPITDPESVFKNYITQISQSAIQQQSMRHSISIRKAIKKGNYPLVLHKLNELNFLAELLDKDTIRNLYNDCIREVNQWISQQYNMHTQTFNKCLSLENNLKLEDILNYQQQMLKIAETKQLRNEHLGQDAISQEAYTSNLKQQTQELKMACFSAQLNDPNVKKILDKLQLLSTVFKEIRIVYLECRAFKLQQFILQTQAFLDLAKGEMIQDSVKILKGIEYAMDQLRDHQDHQIVQQHINSLKSQFLDHMKSKNEVVLQILSKGDVLTSMDIKTIQNTLQEFGSLRENYQHSRVINNSEILSIQQLCLGSVLEHFQKLNKQVWETCESESYRGLQMIESSVMQMTEMRDRIPDIEMQTSKDYFSSLERIFGMFQELVREVENLLELQFDEHSETNKYRRLTDILMLFFQTKWIDKYRPGVYHSTIDEVKKKLNMHAQSLKIQVLAVHLNLKNFSNLQLIVRNVNEIEQIKSLDMIDKMLAQYAEDCNQWLQSNVKAILDQIQNNYQMHPTNPQSVDYNEEAKGTEDDLSIFNAIELENALLFLRQFTELKYPYIEGTFIQYKKQGMELLNTLETFIINYRTQVFQSLTKYLMLIKSYNGVDKNSLFFRVSRIEQILFTIREIYDVTVNVKDLFDRNNQLWTKWLKEIDSYAMNITDEMTRFSGNIQFQADFNNKLQIVKALAAIDDFKQGEKFMDLYRKYSMIYYEKAPHTQRDIIESIKNYKFTPALQIMTSLEIQKDDENSLITLTNLQNILRNTFEELVQETISMANKTQFMDFITEEKIDLIVRNLKAIQSCKDLEKFLADDQKDIGTLVRLIQDTVCKNYKQHLKMIHDEIQTYHFIEADSDLQKLKSIYQSLGPYCTEDIYKQLELLEKAQQDTLDQLLHKYENLEIKNLILNPPKEIFHKLEDRRKSQIYASVYRQLEEVISLKFKKALEEIISYESIKKKQQRLKYIEALLVTLPEKIANMQKTEIMLLNQQFLDEEEMNNCELQEAIENHSIGKIGELLEKCKDQKNHKQQNDIQKYFRNEISQLTIGVSEELDRGFNEKTIAELSNLHQIKKVADKHFPGTFSQPYNNIKIRLNKQFQTIMKEIKNVFDDNNIEDTEGLLDNSSESSSSFLNDSEIHIKKMNINKQLENLVKFWISQQEVCLDMIENFDKSYSNLTTYVKTSIDSTNAKLDQAIATHDFTTVAKSLKNLKSWAKYIQTMKTIEVVINKQDDESGNEPSSFKPHLYLEKQEEVQKSVTNLYTLIQEECKKIQTGSMKGAFQNQHQRESFYKNLKDIILKYGDSVYLQPFIGHKLKFDLKESQEHIIENLKLRIEELKQTMKSLVNSETNTMTKEECLQFSMIFKDLQCIEEYIITSLNIDEQLGLQEVPKQLALIVTTITNKAQMNMDIENIHDCIIELKDYSENLDDFKEQINLKIDEVLQVFQKNKGIHGLAKLSLLLEKNPRGLLILSEHSVFKMYSVSVFNQKTKKHDISYVLDNIDGTDLDKHILLKRYRKFEEEYQKLVKQNLSANIAGLEVNIQRLISDLKIKFKQQNLVKLRKWEGTFKLDIPILVAYIFAIYTLKNSSYFFEADGIENKESYLFTPHPAQVVSIFCLLGIYNYKNDLLNHFIQIGTGEGKSVTLAIAATTLALLGFDVSCVCYSSYLSERDYQAFASLFDILCVTDQIHYGTFNKLCERMINSDFNIRETVVKLIKESQFNKAEKFANKKRPTVLLIDEVDVFFSRDFYGNTYSPKAEVKDQTITDLITHIWNNKQSITYQQMLKSTQYAQVCQRFKGWEFLLQEALKDMVQDVKTFSSQHDYVVADDKIGYKEQDNLLFNISYGYKTLFTYFYEHDNKRISKQSLLERISMGVNCGAFSYAEIPKQFDYIMGVTGTLKSLSAKEKQMLQTNYNIKLLSYMPSVFGKNNLRFDKKDDVYIENQSDYQNRILQEIRKKIRQNRAVLVFFESTKHLNEFYNSDTLASMKDKVKILTEEFNSKEKDSIIKQATQAEQVTLFSRCFGKYISAVTFIALLNEISNFFEITIFNCVNKFL